MRISRRVRNNALRKDKKNTECARMRFAEKEWYYVERSCLK